VFYPLLSKAFEFGFDDICEYIMDTMGLSIDFAEAIQADSMVLDAESYVEELIISGSPTLEVSHRRKEAVRRIPLPKFTGTNVDDHDKENSTSPRLQKPPERELDLENEPPVSLESQRQLEDELQIDLES
jgi:hypothetical protein